MACKLENLEKAYNCSDFETVGEIINNPGHELSDLKSATRDNRKFYSVFHKIAGLLIGEQQLSICLEFTVNAIKLRYTSDYQRHIQSLLNTFNDDGKTPLHTAILYRKIVIVTQTLTKEFLELGADPNLSDRNGQTVIHHCTSLNILYLLVYFHKVKSCDIDIPDENGRTPLHCACFEGQEQSANALIAWSRNVNSLDNNGLSPLHLAAISQSVRIIRHLLMRGASRKTQTLRGETPFQVAVKNNSTPEIIELLKSPSCLQKLNPVCSPIDKITNTYTTFFFYLLLFILRYVIMFVIVVPGLNRYLSMVSIGIFIISFIAFQIASNTDPGYEPVSERMNILDLYEKYNGDFVCAYCELRRSHSIKHCQHCNRCVRKFDHHCPWIHNCVGFKNQRFFVFFLFAIELDFLYMCIVSLFDFFDFYSQDPLYGEILEEYHQYGEYIEIGLAVFCGFCFLIVSPLFCVQLQNAIRKTTTYERFARNQRGSARSRRHKNNEISDTSTMLLQKNQSSDISLGSSDLSSSQLPQEPFDRPNNKRSLCC